MRRQNKKTNNDNKTENNDNNNNKENYNNIEFYNRPFILFDDVYLDNLSYTMLFKESINNSIRKLFYQ